MSYNEPAEHLRAVLYARVSTEEQAEEGYSLAAQLDVMRAYCDVQDMDIVEEIQDDGYSGTNTRRPGYQRLFDPEFRKQWDVLVVMKMDRIHRNSRNFMDMMDLLKKGHQQFVSTYDRIDTSTAIGRFTMDMIQRIAQLESEQTGERTYMGMREKAEEGAGILGFNAPFGYAFDGKGSLELVEDEADTVRDIYRMYIDDGMTMDIIAYNLNSRGTLTRKGNPWNKFNLRTVLHNPIYAGYLHWEEIVWKGDFPNIIEPEYFNRVQLEMASRIRNPKHRNPLLIEV